ncbi:MAG TPA: hypothetical protein VFA98_00240 [Thermoanaerobaculia bacterium]|jgi:hypothetical protein|nr:hypothetical protein [Thermoanaerobaculia bacterium]
MAAVRVPEWLENKSIVKIDWVRVTDFAPYVATGDMEEEPSSRIYSPRGKPYPLLAIDVHPRVRPLLGRTWITERNVIAGVNVSVGFKLKEGDWWEESGVLCAVPLELFGDLFEMLREAEETLRALQERDADNVIQLDPTSLAE